MRRFIEGADRGQSTLFPECLEDWIGEDNPVRVIDIFVDELDLAELGFSGVEAEVTGRPSYHPSALLKIYIYGYLNRVQSSRRLEREAGRNVVVMWLTGRLVPDRTPDYCWLFCGTGTLPVGPIAVTCKITSPSFAHAKCGDLAGSEYNVPAG